MVEMTVDTHSSVSLLVPCRPEYVSLCRLLVGALGAREALDEEDVADLKMIVTEAFNCFLGSADCGPGVLEAKTGGEDDQEAKSAESGASLRLDLVVSANDWTITIASPDGSRRISESVMCDPTSEDSLSLVIIEALADSVERSDEAQGSVLRVVKSFLAPDESTE